MSEQSAAALDPLDSAGLPVVLHALSDPMRLEIVRQLAACTARGDELMCRGLSLPIGKSTASHHLRILRDAGLIGERGEGTRKYLHLRSAEADRRFPGLLAAVLAAAERPATG